MKFASFVFLAVFACAAPAAFAQDPAPAPAPDGQTPPKEEPGYKIRGLSFKVDVPATGVFIHDPTSTGGTPGTAFGVKNYLNHEFSQVPATGNNLVVTKSADPASVKDPASVLAKIKLTENFKKGIVVFLPGSGKAGDPAYRTLVIDDAVRVFPRGSIKIINLSPLPVKITLEKEELDFKPGEIKLVEKLPVNDSNASAMTALAFKDNQWQRFGQTTWAHPGSKRVIQIISENPQTKNAEIASINDISVRDN